MPATQTSSKSSAAVKGIETLGEVRDASRPRRSPHPTGDEAPKVVVVSPIGNRLDIYGEDGRSIRGRLRIYGGSDKVGRRG